MFSFFVLSGFLMTMIMHGTYGYDWRGIRGYAENRFFRLYPMYWAAALFSVVVILIVSSGCAAAYKEELQIPHRWPSIVFNLTMIFPAWFPYTVDPRLSPPTWALTVEIALYVLIGLGLSRTRRRTMVWLAASLVYVAWTYAAGKNEAWRYANIPAAALPFAMGSLLCFVKDDVQRRLGRGVATSPAVVMGALVANAALFAFYSWRAGEHARPPLLDLGTYLNLLLSALAVVALYDRGHELFTKRTDKWLGDFSYPIYLSHWQAGLLASSLLFPTPTIGLSAAGAAAFALALVLVLLWSWAAIETIDRHMTKIRNRIRAKVTDR
ncbi:MAG: acyltransferase [Burkholderiales bacterium]|nr:acyltransferase [Burkholderiales bacterium]